MRDLPPWEYRLCRWEEEMTMDLFPVGSRGCCTGQNGDKHRESAERKCSQVWNQDALDGGTRLQLWPFQKTRRSKTLSPPDLHINHRQHVGCMTQEVLFFWGGWTWLAVFESSIWEQRVVIGRAWAAQWGEREKEMSFESSVCLSSLHQICIDWKSSLFSEQKSGQNGKKKRSLHENHTDISSLRGSLWHLTPFIEMTSTLPVHWVSYSHVHHN